MILVDYEKCCGCFACSSSCPKNAIRDKIVIKSEPLPEAAKANPSLLKSPAEPEKRDRFFSEIKGDKPCDFEKLAKKYCTQKTPAAVKVKVVVKKALKALERRK